MPAEIVGGDAEACQLRRHPPRQIAVRRDQRRLAFAAILPRLFQRQTQGDGNRRCLLALVGRLDQGNIGKGVADRVGRKCLLPCPPAARRFRGRQGTRQDLSAHLHVFGRLGNGFDLASGRVQPLQQQRQAILRVAARRRIDPFADAGFRRNKLPVLFRHGQIEPWQDDDPLR